MSDPPRFRPDEILAALERHHVAYVLIGGLAAALHGSPHVTFDVDVCPDPESANLERLVSALDDLDARVFTEGIPEGLPFGRDAASLLRARTWNLVTRAGRLDLTFEPAGTAGYSDLVRDAIDVEIRGVHVRLGALADVVRSKEAAGREKDRLALPALRELLRLMRDPDD